MVGSSGRLEEAAEGACVCIRRHPHDVQVALARLFLAFSMHHKFSF